MRRYLASFGPAISCHGTEQYVSVDGRLRTSVEVEEAALEVCLALQKVASPASRVVIATDDALWVSVFLLAVWHANMEPVFASSLEARDILAVPKAQVVLTTDVEEVAHKSYLDLKAHGLQLLGFAEDILFTPKAVYCPNIPHPFEYKPTPNFAPVITQMTSGSTGVPQAITRTLAGLMQEVQTVARLYPADIMQDPKLVMCATVPILHAYGLCFRYLLPLYLGVAMMRQAAKWEEQLGPDTANRFSQVWLVTSPAFLRRLGSGPASFNCVFMQTAGGRLERDVTTLAFAYFGQPKFLEILGSTETGVMAWRLVSPQAESTWWNFLEPNALMILAEDKDQRKVIKNQGVGILVVGTSFVEPNLRQFLPMAKAPNTTNSEGLYFVTGDLVELLGDGLHLRFIGRSGRVIKLEDNRFSLDEVEEQLRHSGLMCSCAVTSYECHGRMALQVAVVLNDEGEARLLALGRSKFILALRQKLCTLMPAIVIPRRFIFCAKLPQSASGKILYAEVKGMFEHAFSRR